MVCCLVMVQALPLNSIGRLLISTRFLKAHDQHTYQSSSPPSSNWWSIFALRGPSASTFPRQFLPAPTRFWTESYFGVSLTMSRNRNV